MAEKLTKREMKEQRRLEKLAEATNSTSHSSGSSMKWAVLGVVVLIFLGLFGYLIYSAKQENAKLENMPKVFTKDGYVRGVATAPNTLVEFADFQCPHCKENEPIVEALLQKNKGKLKLQYKYFPLSFKYSYTTARAAQAAGIQGKFWEMHDILFEEQEKIAGSSDARKLIDGYAKQLGLDLVKFNKDFDSDTTSAAIDKIRDEGANAGVTGTPSFFINGKFISIPSDLEEFEKEIAPYLKK